jgi:hypothetical protein
LLALGNPDGGTPKLVPKLDVGLLPEKDVGCGYAVSKTGTGLALPKVEPVLSFVKSGTSPMTGAGLWLLTADDVRNGLTCWPLEPGSKFVLKLELGRGAENPDAGCR